jgi:uncharacterized protein YjiK
MYKRLMIIAIFASILEASSTNLKKIASIPEASGVDYSHSTDTLFVANDEGSIYEISNSGKILREKKVCKCDLEGITDYNKKRFLTVDEKSDTIIFVSKKSLKIKKRVRIDKKIMKKIRKNRKDGFEAISYDNKFIYLGLQSKTSPSSIAVVETDGKLNRVITIKTKDISGLKAIDNKLYVLSDKKNSIYVINLKNDSKIDKMSVGGKDQEGITFVNNKIYIADDSGSILIQK